MQITEILKDARWADKKDKSGDLVSVETLALTATVPCTAIHVLLHFTFDATPAMKDFVGSKNPGDWVAVSGVFMRVGDKIEASITQSGSMNAPEFRIPAGARVSN